MRPYLMDLGSTNGTFLNDERLEPQRYYELLEKVRFLLLFSLYSGMVPAQVFTVACAGYGKIWEQQPRVRTHPREKRVRLPVPIVLV